MSSTNSPAAPLRPNPQAVFAVGAGLLGFACVFFIKLAIPAMTLMLIAFLALPREKDRASRGGQLLLIAAVPFMLIGMLRFTVEEAAAGIIEGGRRHLAKQALYHLREVRFAEDMTREQARVDPDRDGVGSAGTLDELSGHVPFRGTSEPVTGLLRFPPSVAGPEGRVVLLKGYALAVFLPAKDGGAVSDVQGPIDEEQAERRWVAYAWPLEQGIGDVSVVFIDEHERILISDNLAPGQRYFGLERMPRFDAALTGPRMSADAATDAVGQDGGTWKAWRKKQPRATLPGDKPSAATP